MIGRLKRALPAIIGLILFAVALEVLRHELAKVTLRAVITDLQSMPRTRIWAALALTGLNYVALMAYDFLAFASIGRRIAAWKIAVTSFLAYAIANNVGFAMLSGATVRYRFYTRWGVSGEELSRIVFSYSVTFWLGLLSLGGLSLARSPFWAAPLGWLLFGSSLAFVVTSAVRTTPLSVGRFAIQLPGAWLAIAQLVVSAIEWTLAAAVLFVLLPPGSIEFLPAVGVFLLAQLVAMASHVPGGVGIFDGLIVLLLEPFIPAEQVVPALLIYRGIYYLLPLAIALVGLVIDEIIQRRELATRTAKFIGRMATQFTPHALAAITFLAGLVLLLSGATPAAAGRLEWINQFVPLGILETSHFAGSLVGLALLLLSHGLGRRLDAAYHATVIALGIGIAASILKGADIEEAVLLTLVLGLLARSRAWFDRKAALFETRFGVVWTATVAAAVLSSVWLGFFAFKHVEYSNELWWQFELSGDAPRFLRASIGVAVAAVLVSMVRLLAPPPHEIDPPTEIDLRDAGCAISRQTSTIPYLVYLKDKGLVFNERRDGYIMYGVHGRSWIAMGDPVGARDQAPGLIRRFLERADDLGGVPAFYQVRRDYLHHYADFGLAFVKLGEEARIDLNAFSWEGGASSKFRQALKRPEKEGTSFRIIPAGSQPDVMPQLRLVSDDWLEDKSATEKGFSLGFFDRDYLLRFPIAVIEGGGRILAFANLWPGPNQQELSIDLMRYHHEAPKGVMEMLIVHLIQYGQQNGYRWFSLGMAPMSGFEQSPVAPLWAKAGSFLYEHGERMYNFQGLRAFKEKFNPVWEPHYLAYPGGLALPRVLADATALIAGGYRNVLL